MDQRWWKDASWMLEPYKQKNVNRFDRYRVIGENIHYSCVWLQNNVESWNWLKTRESCPSSVDGTCTSLRKAYAHTRKLDWTFVAMIYHIHDIHTILPFFFYIQSYLICCWLSLASWFESIWCGDFLFFYSARKSRTSNLNIIRMWTTQTKTTNIIIFSFIACLCNSQQKRVSATTTTETPSTEEYQNIFQSRHQTTDSKPVDKFRYALYLYHTYRMRLSYYSTDATPTPAHIEKER